VLGRRQGQLDSPLTAAGLAHAHRHARVLAGADLDAIFTSPLGRARTTAGIIPEATGLPVTVIGWLLVRNLLDEDPAMALQRNQPHDQIYVVAGGALTTLGTPA